jgi:hypothetical protein
MKRRTFFSKLASAVAGVYLACHCKAIDDHEVVVTGLSVDPAFVEVNPEWVSAPYELDFCEFGICMRHRDSGETIKSMKHKAGETYFISDPVRMDCDGNHVPKYKAVYKSA